MKNFKRFISLIMILTMGFSLSTVALAAGSEENNNITIGEVSVNENDIQIMSSNALITELTGYYTGSSATTLNIPITVPDTGSYLYFGIRTDGPIVGTLYSNGVKVSTTTILANPIDVQWCQIKFDRSPNSSFWAPGNYTLKVEVMFNYKYSFVIVGTQDELPIK